MFDNMEEVLQTQTTLTTSMYIFTNAIKDKDILTLSKEDADKYIKRSKELAAQLVEKL